jgi:glycosyltransferase involved in cell wall biosynthesis
MRVLHVNKFLYRRGGAEGYMLDVAGLQREQGHEVAFFGMQHPDNDQPQQFERWFPSQVELESAPEGVKGKTAAAARMIWSTSARRGITHVLEEFRPDVVHCHNIYHQLSPSMLEPVRKAGVPCVMTLHDYKLACPSYQLLDNGALCQACVTGGSVTRLLSPMTAARRRCKDGSLGSSALLAVETTLHRAMKAYSPVDVFISPSDFLADVMTRAGVFPERMRVVNHFVDVDTTPVKESAGGDLVFAGRLAREKGIDVLIDAVGAMRTGGRLDIAGDGPLRSELEAQAERVAPGRVRFHGRLAKPELQQLVRGSVASVVPSRWYENQPLTVLESFGAAVPVIATDLGGLPELVRDGVDGLVVAHEQPAALAAAMDALYADPERALKMGAVARERVLADFSTRAHLERLGAAYDAATAHRRSAA